MMLLLVHAAATLCMTGVIWFVQVVHYPLFHRVPSGFRAYEEANMARTTWVVLPLMATELVAASWLVLEPSARFPELWAWAGLGLLGVIWMSTALLQVPCHHTLAQGYDAAVARRLVRTNWIRTLAWSARALLALAMLASD